MLTAKQLHSNHTIHLNLLRAHCKISRHFVPYWACLPSFCFGCIFLGLGGLHCLLLCFVLPLVFPFRFHSTGTMPRRTAAGRRPNVTRARSRSTNSGTSDQPTAASFRSMSVCDLRHTCRSAGLASEGTKNQLINRLCTQHGADRPTTNPPDPPSVTSAAVISANLQAEIQRAVSTAIADLVPALRSMEPRTPQGNPGTSQSDSDLTIVPTPPPGPSSLTTGVLPISSPLTVPAGLSDRILRGEFIVFDDLLPDELGNPVRNSLRLYQRPRASPSANRPHAATNATSMISLPGWKLGQRTAAWYFPSLLTAARNCSPTRQLSLPPLGSFIRKRGFRTTANFVEPQQAARHCGGIPLTLLSGSWPWLAKPGRKHTTPIKVDRLRTLLVDHPDHQFTEYIFHGLERGFSVGYTPPLQNTSCPNLPSASQHPEFVSTSLQEACWRGETAGPLWHQTLPNHVRIRRWCRSKEIRETSPHPPPFLPLGPQRQWRHPKGRLQSPLCDHRRCYFSYPSSRSWLLPIESRHQVGIPHLPGPSRRLAPPGIHWQRKYYFECALPFGLRSSPAIFNSDADAVEWILVNKSRSLLSFTTWTITWTLPGSVYRSPQNSSPSFSMASAIWVFPLPRTSARPKPSSPFPWRRTRHCPIRGPAARWQTTRDQGSSATTTGSQPHHVRLSRNILGQALLRLPCGGTVIFI